MKYIILELERFRIIDGPAEHSVCLIWRVQTKESARKEKHRQRIFIKEKMNTDIKWGNKERTIHKWMAKYIHKIDEATNSRKKVDESINIIIKKNA